MILFVCDIGALADISLTTYSPSYTSPFKLADKAYNDNFSAHAAIHICECKHFEKGKAYSLMRGGVWHGHASNTIIP